MRTCLCHILGSRSHRIEQMAWSALEQNVFVYNLIFQSQTLQSLTSYIGFYELSEERHCLKFRGGTVHL